MGRVPLNMVHAFSRVGLIRGDLLALLPPEAVRECLVLGPVEDGNGRENRNWRSFFSPFEVVVRGTDHVAFRRCPECDWPFYFALGRRYLCPEPVPAVPLAHAGYGQLVVSRELFLGIGDLLKKRVSTLPLEVHDEPRDGLGLFRAGPSR